MSRKTPQILKMQNPIQTYAWGSRSAIADLLGKGSPSPEPQAELWMGAHPKSPSRVRVDGRWESLLDLINQNPLDMLGRKVADRFDHTLPYLFKVLAAAEPLSIQAHPDADQARNGFGRENSKGIDLSDPQRNYRDDRPKPECMCALTPFVGLCGFRSPGEVVANSKPVWPAWADSILGIIEDSNNPNPLQAFFKALMQLDTARLTELTAHVVEEAADLDDPGRIYHWIRRLYQKYPGDVGVLSPLMLNTIQLQPGEALFLPPKQLHAYLDGLGIELMGNSDNVLRGGLTQKHIDVQELMGILDFRPYRPEILAAQFKSDTEGLYASSTETFALSQLIVSSGRTHRAKRSNPGPEIILGVEGRAAIRQHAKADELIIEKGTSVFIPAAVESYTVTGDARLFNAAVNL